MPKRSQTIGHKLLTNQPLTQPERVWVARLINANNLFSEIIAAKVEDYSPIAAERQFSIITNLLSEETPQSKKATK